MGRLDEAGQAWLESQSEYSNAATAGVVAGAFVPIPGGPIVKALNKLGILLSPGTARVAVGSGGRNAAVRLFNELRAPGAPVIRRGPGVYTAPSVHGYGDVTFRFPGASSSNMWSVDFRRYPGPIHKIHF